MSTISVFVACYNYGRFLEKCLGSILAQTRPADEILMIDDCSEDNTRAVAKKFRGKIRYVRNPKNLGSSKTFNLGPKLAKGDYILALSADDWLAPAMLAKEAAVLDNHPEIGLVYAQAYNFIDGKISLNVAKPAGSKSYIGRQNDFELLLTQGCFITAQTPLVRKSIYRKLGSWDTNLRFCQDYEMFTRIAKHYPLAYIDQPLAYYRIHKESLMKKGNWPSHLKEEYAYILKKHLKGAESSLKKRAYFNYHLTVAGTAATVGKFKRA